MGNYTIQRPKWTDDITDIKNPLIFVQFLEYFFASWGVGLIIRELQQSQSPNLLEVCLIFGGLGIRNGIFLLLNKKIKT